MWTLLLAGILALPPLLWLVLTIPILAILSLPATYLLLARKSFKKPSTTTTTVNSSRHVIITGGSSGIGLAIAKSSAKSSTKKGSSNIQRITILARDSKKLQAAQETIQALNPKIVVQTLVVDVTKPDELQQAATTLFANATTTTETTTTTTHLFCCAGFAVSRHWKDYTTANFMDMIQTNQLGSMFTSQAFLPHMKQGTITFCSSGGGQIGVFGYAAYCPTKFALRGYAECLHMELTDKPIHIQVAYPSDTDTPGFATENIGKPQETILLSDTGGLSDPDDIGSEMLQEAMVANPKFNVYFNFDGFILSNLCAGFSPVTNLGDALVQVTSMTLFRWISLFILQSWYLTIYNYQNKQHKKVVDNDEVKPATTPSETNDNTSKSKSK